MEKENDSGMIKVAVIGPESAGKSTLCLEVSKFFELSFIPEISREFLTNLNRPYTIEDLDLIAEKQFRLIKEMELKRDKLLVSDTEVLTIRIWSLIKYGKCSDLINNLLKQQNFHHYLLCNTDIEWMPDPLREVPDLKKRIEIFELFQNEMKQNNWPYTIIHGKEDARFLQAKSILETLTISKY